MRPEKHSLRLSHYGFIDNIKNSLALPLPILLSESEKFLSYYCVTLNHMKEHADRLTLKVFPEVWRIASATFFCALSVEASSLDNWHHRQKPPFGTIYGTILRSSSLRRTILQDFSDRP